MYLCRGGADKSGLKAKGEVSEAFLEVHGQVTSRVT